MSERMFYREMWDTNEWGKPFCVLKEKNSVREWLWREIWCNMNKLCFDIVPFKHFYRRHPLQVVLMMMMMMMIMHTMFSPLPGTPSADNPAPQRGGPSLLERLSAQSSSAVAAAAAAAANKVCIILLRKYQFIGDRFS